MQNNPGSQEVHSGFAACGLVRKYPYSHCFLTMVTDQEQVISQLCFCDVMKNNYFPICSCES